jgi:hypothetical protein
MRREGSALQLAVEIPDADRVECVWVQSIGWAVLFAREHDAGMKEDVCVGRGADLELDSVSVLAAVFAEKGASCFSLPNQLFRFHVSLLEVDEAVFDTEGANQAVAVEPLFVRSPWKLIFHAYSKESLRWLRSRLSAGTTYNVVLDEGRLSWVRHDAVEGAI